MFFSDLTSALTMTITPSTGDDIDSQYLKLTLEVGIPPEVNIVLKIVEGPVQFFSGYWCGSTVYITSI